LEVAEKYKEQFINDTRQFRDYLENLLQDWQTISKNKDKLNELYRTAHSLKSGAGFLELETLEKAAHSLEDAISNVEESSTEDLQKQVEELLDIILRPDMGGRRNSASQAPIAQAEADESSSLTGRTDLDRTLLEDARFRGESLFRIECMIDRAEPMKRARAYLLMNQMELHCNVLRTEPAMEDENASFHRFILYITSDLDVDYIRSLLNFDQITSIDIHEISMKNLDGLPQTEDVFFAGLLEEKKNLLSIEREDLDDLNSLWDEFYHSLAGLSWENEQGKRLARILREGRKKLDQMSRFALQDLEQELAERVLSYSHKVEKNAVFQMQGGDIRLPREWLSPLLRILQQLVRNSLVHGIESPEERKTLGKSPSGRLSLILEDQDGSLLLIYEDDGKGIDEERLRSKQKALIRREDKSNPSLLQLITTRGLSNTDQADTYSGRGIGMDLLVQAVENELHGSIQLKNNPGKGLRFMIHLPMNLGRVYLQFRYHGAVYMLAKSYVKETGTLHSKQIWRRKNGDYYLKEQSFLPIYTVSGALNNLEDIQQCFFWIKLRYLGKTAYLIAEDLMVEKVFSMDQEQRLRKKYDQNSTSALLSLGKNNFMLLPNLIE